MSASDRTRWIDRGSPFRLMQPAKDLRDTLRRHGYTVYDIGNRAHLEHEPPEDHTPYSETAYPGRSVYGVGYAVDIMPPSSGQRSKVDGLPLPSLQQLGAQLLADRKAGVSGIRWLKYMNWEPERNNGGPCYQDSWKPNYARRSSSDRGHIHLSGLTGYETSSIGAGYDPVARIRGDDMPLTSADKMGIWTWDLKDGDGTDPAYKVLNRAAADAAAAKAEATKARLTGEAILAAVKGVDTKAVLARINEVATAESRRDAELLGKILAALPSGSAPVSREELEAALRTVLGSVDNAQAG